MAPKKILIVEDEVIIAEDIADTLRSFDYDVVGIAPNGEKAIEIAGKTQPDLILMDIMMPGEIDGVEAAEQIRSRFHLPVVYLTAYADGKTLARAALTEPFGYLVKPFEDKELYTIIKIALTRHQAEEKTRASLEAAEALRKSDSPEREQKSSSLSMAAYGFRNPLTNILTSVELLKMHSDNWSEAKKLQYVDRLQAAASQMDDLLEDILTQGHSQAGAWERGAGSGHSQAGAWERGAGSGHSQAGAWGQKVAFTPELLDVVEFCRNLVEAVQQIALSKHEINFLPQAPCTDVFLDEKLLYHILTNLLSNAIKYSPLGGNVYLELVCDGNEAIFRIKDSGIGIPLEAQAHLFETFHRAHNVGSIPGTGLGLAIVKKAVDLHGGEIAVASEVGVGTTFTVTIPTPSFPGSRLGM